MHSVPGEAEPGVGSKKESHDTCFGVVARDELRAMAASSMQGKDA